MLAFSLDATAGFIGWFIIILIGYAVVKWLKKEPFKPIPFRGILIAVFILAITPAIVDLVSGKYSVQPSTSEEEQELGTILQNCMSGSKISNGEHAKFWELVGAKKISERDIDQMIAAFYNPDLLEYQKLFWQDALSSLKNGSLYKSETRSQLEQKLLSTDLLTKDRQLENDNNLIKIANKELIPIGDTLVVVDENIANLMLSNVDSIFTLAKDNFEFLKDKNAIRD